MIIIQLHFIEKLIWKEIMLIQILQDLLCVIEKESVIFLELILMNLFNGQFSQFLWQ